MISLRIIRSSGIPSLSSEQSKPRDLEIEFACTCPTFSDLVLMMLGKPQNEHENKYIRNPKIHERL